MTFREASRPTADMLPVSRNSDWALIGPWDGDAPSDREVLALFLDPPRGPLDELLLDVGLLGRPARPCRWARRPGPGGTGG